MAFEDTPSILAERSPAEVLRDRLLKTSWQHLGLIEELGPGGTARLLARQLQAERANAGVKVPPLDRWPTLPASSYGTYIEGTNPVRIARVLDFLQAGDRVLDIGIGYGYLSTVMARTGLLEYYCGVDLTQRYVDTTTEGLEWNGVPSDNVHLEVNDLYALTAPWIAEHRPDLVLVLEVLEHVPDTEGALRHLASILAPGTSILFTVPMIGRLEGVWGHRSLFDQQRIRQLCEAAGLTIQYVEPLHNVWTLVLATTTPEVPDRLLTAAAAPIPAPEPETRHDYVFQDVDLKRPGAEFRRQGRPKRGRAVVRRTRQGLHCEVSATDVTTAPYYGGLALPVEAPAVVRLQIQYEDASQIDAVYVDGYEGDERVARWKWSLNEVPPTSDVIVHVIKPGPSGRFKPVGRLQAERIDRLEIYVQLHDEATETAFTLMRAAYVGGWVGE
ncbi:MAG TPA: class I SAM-dependent methyltransferase [Solirubrobacteraceae bacterium]|jgi:2-polyprenyl-3-methyl-5-hydroxy-6-metoxy-1,4-benzoquinol methylase